jgi:glycosyltransferase involved in cell wall biosynthesis
VTRVYVLPAEEGWICDQLVKDWNDGNPDMHASAPEYANVVWLLSDWRWRHLPIDLLRQKLVLTTVHHIVPEKFGDFERIDFGLRDQVTTAYHVYNKRTLDFIRPLTQKPICLVTYWANQHLWRQTENKQVLQELYGLPSNAFVCGSFQRDTEGAGISQGTFLPKLEKGPDLLADYLESLLPTHPTLHVLLAGWRRQYLISRLEKAHVPFTYIERPSHEVINELYQCCDLYPVTARHEGGPQSLIECGLLGVPVVSRPVGIAEQVLPSSAIADNVMNAVPAVPNVEAWKLPNGFKGYRGLIESLVNPWQGGW